MSLSPEEAIWSSEAAAPRVESVRDRIAIVQPVPENFYERCAHGIAGGRCDVCRAIRERDAARAAVTVAQPVQSPSVSQTVVAQPLPFLSGMTVVPAPEAEPVPKPPVVQIAEEYAQAIAKLRQEEKLLIGAELRVESLKESIATLKVTAEETRLKLAKLVSTGETQ